MTHVEGIDHLILAVNDLPAAVALYQDSLGFHLGGGGSHPQFGTANRIIVLADEYIELLAAQEGAETSGLVGDLLREGGSRMACVLAVDNPAAFAADLRQKGFEIDGPAAGRLEAAQGYSRAWQTVALSNPALPGIPFVIRHETTGDRRRALLAGPPGMAPHPNAARRVSSVTFAVHDAERAAAFLAESLDLPRRSTGNDGMLAAVTFAADLQSGARLVFASPAKAGVGPVAAALAAHGESMFSFCLAVDDLAGTVKTLRGRGVGVRVDEPGGVLVAAQISSRDTGGVRIGLVGADV